MICRPLRISLVSMERLLMALRGSVAHGVAPGTESRFVEIRAPVEPGSRRITKGAHHGRVVDIRREIRG
jgi:hypothetical protein